ncbi:hypothetical protein [Acetobacterium woodii]|uniref:Uncharacterized protein n=1 Tax=Acetobacterium woodii (strain ATCC 29683 / DSM 1030 / JCM 2381 / KCTC 1655 / WB1) TaxID=931626 RepID=H6LI07_ACEWD|nr:hypothetical protein [Acetobacterium woodii]AFA48537.1 hypothetical protein Awo_c17570 [Acetobacterium woodii DSM 1030]
MTSKRRKALAQIVKKYGIFIIEDGAYHFLGPHQQPAVATYAPETQDELEQGLKILKAILDQFR